MSSAKIFWLASYPKSGNTWLRVLLTNLRADQEQAIDINKMETHGIASAKGIFEDELGISVADLSADEVNNLRPEVYCSYSKKQPHDIYMKVHDSYQLNDQQQPLFPNACSGGAIYIVRNPLDVCVSLSNHLNVSLEKSAATLNNKNYKFCNKKDRDHNQLKQHLGDWSSHVNSWMNAQMPVHLVRYEDLLTDTFGEFKKITQFMGLDYSDEQLKRAVAFSDIKVLQKQEKENDFKERPSKSKAFFRKGVAGDGKTQLSPALQDKLTSFHQATLKKLNYLTGFN